MMGMEQNPNIAAQLEAHAQRLEDQARDESDPAQAAAYRLRSRQAEELARAERIDSGEDPFGGFRPLPMFWKAPRDEADAPHIVRFHWDDDGLFALEVARTDGQPLRLSDLRDSSLFPFRELIRLDRENNAANLAAWSKAGEVSPEYQAASDELRNRVEESRSPYSAEHWEEVARVYSEAVANHDPAPVRRVAEANYVNRSTARNWIAKCRKLGYLPPTEERKAKGNT